MPDFVHAIVYVLFAWWFSTGAILYLDRLPRGTFRWTAMGATAVMVASVVALVVTRSDQSLWGAFVAFTASLMIWGWNEVLFLTGIVTGPYKRSCPAGASGWRHFRYASLSILHHEILILASAGVIFLATLGAANNVGLWTFVVLYLMRLSTKLNIFLGVPNLSEEMLPDHLAYLASFFRRRAMNPLFPISITASSVALTAIVMRAAASTSAFERTSLALLATLIGLGLLEHWFLVLPLRSSGLWTWGLSTPQSAPEVTTDPNSISQPASQNVTRAAATVR